MSQALIKQVQYLKENGFTEQQANTLIYFQRDHIEHVMATKKDLAEVHANLKKDIEYVKKDIEQLRADTKKDIAEVKKDIEYVKKDIELLRTETKKDIEYLRTETKKDIAEIKKDIEYLRTETKKDIAEIKKDLILKLSVIMGSMITIAGVLLGFLN